MKYWLWVESPNANQEISKIEHGEPKFIHRSRVEVIKKHADDTEALWGNRGESVEEFLACDRHRRCPDTLVILWGYPL
tara:strand:+ start:1422 stop:1655 length:234 start_codon:yes stop_codon:yes gene_type:complete